MEHWDALHTIPKVLEVRGVYSGTPLPGIPLQWWQQEGD